MHAHKHAVPVVGSFCVVLLAGSRATAVPMSHIAAPTDATQAWVDLNPDHRVFTGSRGQIILYGADLATGTIGQGAGEYSDAEAFVWDFLQSNGDAFGVNTATFQKAKDFIIRDGKFHIFHYEQTTIIEAETLPMEVDKAVRILVWIDGSTRTITYAASNLAQDPESPFPAESPTFDEQAAIDKLELEYTALTFPSASEVEKVVYVADDNEMYRAWMIDGVGEEEAYRFYLDTASTEIVGIGDLMSHWDWNGSAVFKGEREPCCHPGRYDWPECCPSGQADCCCNDPSDVYPECAHVCCGFDSAIASNGGTVSVPLPGMQYAFDDACGFTPPSTWNPIDLADANGELAFGQWVGDTWYPDEPGLWDELPTYLWGRLSNDVVTVYNVSQGGAACPSGTIQDGCRSISDDVPDDEDDDPISVLVGPSHPTPLIRCQVAAVNAYLVVNEVYDWFNRLQESVAPDLIPISVKFQPSHSAQYSGGVIYISSNQVGGSPTVIAHEFGHHIAVKYASAVSKKVS